jgi:hypothetical protein
MQKPYPKYYTMKTLLGGDPDTNRRSIHRLGRIDNQFDGHEVCVFNQDMQPWTEQNQRELDICVQALINAEQNQRELDICVQALINASQTADTIPQPQSETPPSCTPALLEKSQ